MEITWDILRLHRFRSGIINGALPQALEGLLKQVLCSEGLEGFLERERAAEELARRWLESDEAKAEVTELLESASSTRQQSKPKHFDCGRWSSSVSPACWSWRWSAAAQPFASSPDTDATWRSTCIRPAIELLRKTTRRNW